MLLGISNADLVSFMVRYPRLHISSWEYQMAVLASRKFKLKAQLWSIEESQLVITDCDTGQS